MQKDMDKKVFNKQKFDAYYDSLPLDEKRRVRDEFLKVSGLSYPAWFTKRRRGNFSTLQIQAMKKITGFNFACN